MTAPAAEQNPWTRPRVLVPLVAVAAIATLTVGALAVATALPRPGGEQSACGLDAVELSGTLTAAPEAEWDVVGDVVAPGSEEHGPGRVDDDGFRSCFARTPEGAVLAAANLVALGSDAAIENEITERLVASGPGRDAALERPPVTDSGDSGSVRLEGFRLHGYTGDTAEVELAISGSVGLYFSQTFFLVWEGGDWKVQLAPTGELPTGLVQIPSAAGYISWTGATAMSSAGTGSPA